MWSGDMATYHGTHFSDLIHKKTHTTHQQIGKKSHQCRFMYGGEQEMQHDRQAAILKWFFTRLVDALKGIAQLRELRCWWNIPTLVG